MSILGSRRRALVLYTVLLVGAVCGALILIHALRLASMLQPRYPFLSSRIQQDFGRDILINFKPLRGQMQQYLAAQPEEVGAYFEYLPTGISIGVREKQPFIMVSLLKVPLAMSIYRLLDEGEISLEEELPVTADDLDHWFGDEWRKGNHRILTVRDALELSIAHSDNTAHNVLLDLALRYPKEYLEDVFDYLEVPRELDGPHAVVTPKNYSSILKSLYFSSYLSFESSHALLRTLIRSVHRDGIPAGLPPSVSAAHKIGVYETEDAGESMFSDCGIVYLERRTYILCIMMHGTEQRAATVMSDVSRMVYQYVSTVEPTRI